MPRSSKALTVGVVSAIDSSPKKVPKSPKSSKKSAAYTLAREKSALIKKNDNFDNVFSGEVEQRDKELQRLMDKVARVEAEILSVKAENESVKLQISKLNAENVDLNEKKQSLMWQCRKLQGAECTPMDGVESDASARDDESMERL